MGHPVCGRSSVRREWRFLIISWMCIYTGTENKRAPGASSAGGLPDFQGPAAWLDGRERGPAPSQPYHSGFPSANKRGPVRIRCAATAGGRRSAMRTGPPFLPGGAIRADGGPTRPGASSPPCRWRQRRLAARRGSSRPIRLKIAQWPGVPPGPPLPRPGRGPSWPPLNLRANSWVLPRAF